MNAEKVSLFICICMNYGHLEYLNLNNQELICLYQECEFLKRKANLKNDLLRRLIRTCITYGHLGYLNLEDQELICLYNECLIISQYVEDHKSSVQLYMLLGELKDKMQCFEESKEYFNQMKKHTEQLQNHCIFSTWVANGFIEMANRYSMLYNLQKVIQCCEKAIDLSRNTDFGKTIEGEAYRILAVIHMKLGKYNESKKYSEICVGIGEEARDEESEAIGYLHLGAATFSLGKRNEAITFYEECIRIASIIGKKELVGAAYTDLALAYEKLGKFDEEKWCLEQSQGLESGEKAESYGVLGSVKQISGNYSEALDCFQKELSMSKSSGDKYVEGNSYIKLGMLSYSLGKYHEAIRYFEEGLKVFKDIGNRSKEGEVLGMLAGVYHAVVNYQGCRENINKSLEIAIETGDKDSEVSCYSQLAHVHQNSKEYDKALEYHVKTLSHAREIDDRTREGIAYCDLGNLCLAFNDPKEAISYFEESLRIAKSIKDKQGEELSHLGLGRAYLCIKKHGEAITSLKKSLDLAKSGSDKSGFVDKRIIGEASHTLGLVYYDLGAMYGKKGDEKKCQEALEKAEEYLKEALKYWEWEFTHLKNLDDFKISIVDRFQTYKKLTKLLIERQKTDEALLISERRRARSLGDILAKMYGITEESSPSQTPLDSTGLQSVLSSNQFCILFLDINDQNLHAWVLTHQKPVAFALKPLNKTTMDALAAVKEDKIKWK